MTTQPPSNEAVEAALIYAKYKDLKAEHFATLDANARYPDEPSMATSARILAAEVERLRAKEEEGCVWAGFSTHGRVHYKTCRGVLNYTEMPRLQFIPYCPGCGRKVKIQPQTNENEP